MNERELTRLLRDADDDAPAPLVPLADSLAARTRRSAANAARARTASVVATGATLVVALSVWVSIEKPQFWRGSSARADDAASLRADFAILTVNADQRMTAVNRVISDDRRQHRSQALAQRLRQSAPSESGALHRERAAATLLRDARARPDASRQSYLRVIELFPDTAAADVARRRLDRDASM
jgi:hypothetical protein